MSGRVPAGRLVARRALVLIVATGAAFLVATGPAAADPVPTFVPARSGDLAAVSCASETFCAAVGMAGLQHPFDEDYPGLLETRDATGWHAVLTGPHGDLSPRYTGVSCASASSCLAVGEDYSTSFGAQSASWNGTRWKELQGPHGVKSLRAVSCPSTNRCLAVGFMTSGGPDAAVTSYDGRTWSVSALAPPAGVARALLTAVSCPTPRFCVALGRGIRSAGNGLTGLVAVLNGGAWTWVPGAAPDATTSGYSAVDCRSTSSCVVTGVADGEPFVARGDGTSWTRDPTTPRSFIGLSCPRMTECQAVGYRVGADGRTAMPVADHGDGTSWTPSTPVAVGQWSLFTAVSCVGINLCIAVGQTEVARNSVDVVEYTVAERWTGRQWVREAA